MAIKPTDFYNLLVSHGVEFFTGVPDSLLKEFCFCIDDRISGDKHIIAPNEGNAIALAAGYYLANKSLPLVYMQNSGIGNAINPLLSLCDPDVYSIPMLVIIGWRGEPGVQDEPQHVKQGKIQLELLKIMDIPFEIISKEEGFENKTTRLIESAINNNRPVVLMVKKGTFEQYTKDIIEANKNGMMREEALEIVMENIDDKAIVISTTGKTSREIFEIREKRNESHQQDFLTVGSMGHCSSIALGIAIGKPDRKVFCIDGDGALLMHMGSLTSITSLKQKNFRHILMNNKVHESVGGQNTAAKNVDLSAIAKAAGYNKIYTAETPNELKVCMDHFLIGDGPDLLEVKICPGSRQDLGRPTIKPVDNKVSFMTFIEN